MAGTHALIGVGGIGSYHLASLQKLAQQGITRPVAVAESNSARFTELRPQLESQGIRWYFDYREMLREESSLDVVTIATPIPLHFEMTQECLRRGVYVNLEKPPVPTIQQLTSLVALDSQRRVTVGFQMILSRCLQRMKQLLVAGEIGEVRHIRACGCWPRGSRYYQRANWAGKMMLGNEPVFDGPATNALAHLIHNVMFLAAPQPGQFAVPEEVTGELYRARPIESYDVACLRGSFRSGADFCVAVTHAVKDPSPFKIEVQGTRGWLRLSDDGTRLETSAGETLVAAETTQQLLDTCHHEFALAIRAPGREPYTSLEDTTGYVRATNGLFLSSGGIHDISPQWVNTHGGSDDEVYNVQGLAAAIERAFSEGLLFSEQGLPWAVAHPTVVRLGSFETLDLRANELQPVT